MTKIITTLTLIFCFLTISLTLEARQIVTGQVTEELDGIPVPLASVFIAGTTIGTHTDIDGNFSLTVPIQGNFQIVVSHIGFLPVSHTVDTPQSSHQINFALQKRIEILAEVVVTPCLPHRRRDENLFWQLLLGERPSNRGMQVLNPEVVQFCLHDNGTFRAFADEPIEIVNHHMGYHILYILQSFEHDGRGPRLLGMPFFTELTPENERQKTNWKSRRQRAYPTSLIRFLRSLYQEQLYENGFVLAKMEQDRLIPLSLTPEDSIRMGIAESFDASFANPNVITSFSYSQILQREAEAVQINTEQRMFLAFTSRRITDVMSNPARIFDNSSLFIEFFPLNITIFADGSYSGTLHLWEHRGTTTQLRTKLPLDFRLNESVSRTSIFRLRRGS